MTNQTWIGRTLGGRYFIEEELGRGGMSSVFKATDANLRRVVAVKMIHPQYSDDAEFVRRFEAEATVVAQLRHPNIVQVYDFNREGDTYYIVFEYVAGETLQERMKRSLAANQRISQEETIKITSKVADALQYAHDRNLIHRDVKPANVILNPEGEPILTDFGIAKMVGGVQHTAAGAVLGTARYMSPEQVKGQRVNFSTDIYSLGVMLYEMVGGRPPFNADSAVSVLMMHVNEPVPDVRRLRPDVSPALVAVVNRSMAKNPDDRYKTAARMGSALRGADQGAATVAPMAVEQTGSAAPKAAVAAGAMAAATGTAPQATTKPPAGTAAGSTGAQTPIPAPAPAAKASSRKMPLVAGGIVLLLLLLCAGVVLGYAFLGGNDDEPESTVVGEVVELTQAAVTEEAEGPEAGPTEAASTAVVPTLKATNTSTPVPVEATATRAAPTLAPSPTRGEVTSQPTATQETVEPLPTAPAAGPTVRITNITLIDGRYFVDFVASGYTPSVPGTHVHFFFNTVAPENAGVPGGGPWKLYGGPSPFDEYAFSEKPVPATQMCALVANPDHSIQLGTGNCMSLPPG